MNSITYNWWSFAPTIFWQAFQRKLARAGSDVSKMAGRSGKCSRNLIDYAQLNRFSSADIEYRHFFCCHAKNEVSLQIRFYFPTNYIKFLIILPLLSYPSWVYFCTDCKRGCSFQNGGQISFFFFYSDLREIFADFKA